MSRAKQEPRATDTPHSNLPPVLTSFIGREREIADISGLLTSARLVTLTGAAGCGKTRLALRAATEVKDQHARAIYWVELARLVDAALVPQTVAKALHVPEQADRTALERIVDAVGETHLLLVLDNCEHLRDACAQLVEPLLSSTNITVLATSREPLGVTGERLYPVAPMSLPPDIATLHEAQQSEAIELFVERARALLPAFALTAKNASTVAIICRALDGIPLAIELASARVNVLTTEQIATRLHGLFSLLPASVQFTHSHHDTLRAAIDWSYDQLSAPEQRMLQRLSIFAGGCSLTTAESVCVGGEIERGQVLDLLASLVNKSLVVAQTLHSGEARYTLLETIRQYAQERLVATGDEPRMRNRHLHCFLQLAEEVEPKLSGAYQQLWLNWLEREFDNMRAALTWALEHNHVAAGLRILIATYQLWTIRDYVEEGLARYERLLARVSGDISPVIHANALAYAANLSGFRGNSKKQIAYGREAAVVAESAGEAGKRALAWALAAQAIGARALGDFPTEFKLARRTIALYRELGDTYLLAIGLSIWSYSAMSVGEYAEAHAMLDESLPMLREIGNPYRIAMALNFSGDLARCEENYQQAHAYYEESITILRDIHAMRDLASVLHNLGHVHLHLGQIDTAQSLFIESMETHDAQGNTAGMAECLIGFAALTIMGGDAAAGIRLLSAATALRGQPAKAMWAATRMEYEHYLAQAATQLSAADLATAQTTGQVLSLEQARSEAEQIAGATGPSRRDSDAPDALTRRELEVTALIADAKSNSEIAAELVLSKRTVEKHIANIRAKLGIKKRAELVRWAIDQNLLSRDQ